MAWIGALALACAAPAHAQRRLPEEERASETDPRLEQLRAARDALGSDDASARRAAYEQLTHLDEDMLPAIRTRIAELRLRRPPERVAFALFNRVRRAAGSLRADDDVDIAPGALALLDEDRSAPALAIAEPLLLWRSLERQRTFESTRAMLPLIGIDGELWRWESRRAVARLGNDAMAAAIVGRSHEDRWARSWSRWAGAHLGADDPGRAVQGLAPAQLADVLRAYAMLRVQSAMPIAVSYVGSERRTVRHAARWAIEQYGPGAIWVLRTAHHQHLGQHPPREWGWRRIADAIYAHHDAQRLAPIEAALREGIAAHEAGDLDRMRARFDDVLARAVDVDDAGPLAAGYAELADRRAREDRLAEAAILYERALRLAPEHPDAAAWRAQATFAGAQQALSRGVWDEDAYRRVLELAPAHGPAQRALSAVEARASGDRDPRSTWAWIAAALFAVAGAGAAWRRRSTIHADDDDRTLDETPELEPHEASLAESTSPG